MKYWKLAVRNVRKSYKDYFVYFMTLMVSVCLFYTFNSFSAQEGILQLSDSQSKIMQTVGQMMNVLSVFVALVLAFLILYANNFLIRRRKQEFGLYMLLGMKKSGISRILVYETLIVGLLSLLSGIALGILCSQAMGMFSAHMLHVDIRYHVVLSFDSALMTMLSFGVIFFIIMLFNTRVIGKVKLIELLQAKKKKETTRLYRPWVSVILFILSIGMLGIAYYLATASLQSFAMMLTPILIIGGIGTILFFVSLSGFLLLFIRQSKSLYYRHLHMVVLRQIHAKISSTSLSMGIVCLMLLISIGALSCGLSLQSSLQGQIEKLTPYTYSYMQNEAIPEADMKRLLRVEEAQAWGRVKVYEDGSTLEALAHKLPKNLEGLLYAKAKMPFIPLRDYNHAMRMQGKKEVHLKNQEAFFISGDTRVLKAIEGLSLSSYSAWKQPLTIVKKTEDSTCISSNDFASIMLGLVVQEDVLQGQPKEVYWNLNLDKGENSKTYTKETKARFASYVKQHPLQGYTYSGRTAMEIKEEFMGSGLLFIYIGLYLGVVFLVASAAILALQQLSEAEDNKANYEVLRKIGTPAKMMNHSILLQIAIYFLLPMILAIVHACVGVPVVSNAFSLLFGLQDMWKSNLITAGILCLIYGTYFLITYQGYRRALAK